MMPTKTWKESRKDHYLIDRFIKEYRLFIHLTQTFFFRKGFGILLCYVILECYDSLNFSKTDVCTEWTLKVKIVNTLLYKEIIA